MLQRGGWAQGSPSSDLARICISSLQGKRWTVKLTRPPNVNLSDIVPERGPCNDIQLLFKSASRSRRASQHLTVPARIWETNCFYAGWVSFGIINLEHYRARTICFDYTFDLLWRVYFHPTEYNFFCQQLTGTRNGTWHLRMQISNSDSLELAARYIYLLSSGLRKDLWRLWNFPTN